MRFPIDIIQVYPHTKSTRFCELIARLTGATPHADFTAGDIKCSVWCVASV